MVSFTVATNFCHHYIRLTNSLDFDPKKRFQNSISQVMFQFCGLCVGNVGPDHAVFEQGASAGNVGSDKLVEEEKANPVALLLSSAMLLRHLQFPSFADRLETAVKRVVADGRRTTKDLGGNCTTQEIVDAVIANLD